MGKLLFNIEYLWGTSESPLRLKKGKDMSEISYIKNAWLLTEGDKISGFGEMKDVPENGNHELFDLSGHSVLPAFCDSHSHLVFAAPRDGEFEDRIKGLTYEEIAKRGGGILNSAEKLAQLSEEELFQRSEQRLRKVIQLGTGAIEIKSGYGLSLEAELKMLRIIRRLKNLNLIPVKATLLGLHALPAEFKNNKSAYVKMVGEELLPAAVKEGLVDFVDVFCEKGYFDTEDTDYILKKASEFGIKGKIHVNQFNILGGVKTAVENKALSVDHLEYLSEQDISDLAGCETIATILPSCSFFLGLPYGDAKKLMENNITVALASDYNPGSTPSGNMSFVWSLACIKMKMTPVQALNALTINGAAAMGLSDITGSLEKGKLANLVVTRKIPSLSYIPYSFGENNVHRVMTGGNWFN